MSWVGWGVFVVSQVPLGTFALLLFACFVDYRSSRDRLRRALYSTENAGRDLTSERERFQSEWDRQRHSLYSTENAAGDLTSEQERFQSVWGHLVTKLYSTEDAAGGLVRDWDRLQGACRVLTAVILATAIFGIADGLVLCGVVGPGWPVPANISTEFLVLGAGALIGLLLMAYEPKISPAVYMWPLAIGLVACLVVMKAWPTAGPLSGAVSAAPRTSVPAGISHAGSASASNGLGVWQVAATMIGAAGTFMIGSAAVFRRRVGR